MSDAACSGSCSPGTPPRAQRRPGTLGIDVSPLRAADLNEPPFSPVLGQLNYYQVLLETGARGSPCVKRLRGRSLKASVQLLSIVFNHK